VPLLLSTHKAFQVVRRNLSFCYLCGQPLNNAEQTNRDHVPPSGLFAVEDREPSLILPTHYRCNRERSGEDQVIAQLVGVLPGRRVNDAHNKLRVAVGQFEDGNSFAVLSDIDIRQIIRRWIRGFHAALYDEFLPGDAVFATYPPLPEGRRDGDKITFVAIPEAYSKFVDELKRNRLVQNLDRIVSRNGKCRYECVWSQSDDSHWNCIYGLDIYNWIDLGDIKNFPARGCVGLYRRPSGGAPGSRQPRLG
jgi:hypothetical protein